MLFPQHKTHILDANNDALYRAQTSMTSLPPEFTRNQLRLSKKGEFSPPPLCPSPDFISALLQLFIPLLFLLLLHCHDFISTPLLFKRIRRASKCTFSFFAKTKRRQTRSYFLLLTVPSPLSLLIPSLS